MKNKNLRKSLAFVIVVLFVVVSFIPSISSGNIKQSNYAKDVKNKIGTIGNIDPLPTNALLNRDFVLKSNDMNNLKTKDMMDVDPGDLDTPLFDFSELMNGSGYQTAWGLTSADFNNDGNMDFAVAYADLPFTHAIISIFYNNGNDNFTKDDVYTFYYDYISNLNSGDFDNDGYIDLLYTYNNYVWYQGLPIYVNGTVNLLKNDGTNSFGPSIEVARLLGPNIPYDPENRINPKLTIADYNEDGNLDFIVGDNSGTVELYDNDGSGNFSSAGIIHDYGDDNGGDIGLAWGVTSADFDGDADIDLLVAARVMDYFGHIYFIQNMMTESNHSTIFEPGPGKIIADITKGIRGTAFLTSLDYNDNGMTDFIAGIENEAYLYINKGGGTFEPFYICRLPDNQAGYMDVLTFGGMTSADYNNDGCTDVIMGGVQGHVRLLVNNHVLAVITRPKDGYFYKNDEEQYQISKYEGVLVIGKITIQAKELEELEKVEFYINDRLKSVDTEPPYEWLWNDFSLGRYVLKIVAYNPDETRNSKHEMIVWKVQVFTIYNINQFSQSRQSHSSPQSQPSSQQSQSSPQNQQSSPSVQQYSQNLQINQLLQNLLIRHQMTNR